MDTSGNWPTLSDDDPLFEVASYTQVLRDKLEYHQRMQFKATNFAVAANSPWDIGPLVKDTSGPKNNTGYEFATTAGVGSGTIKFTEAGWYVISALVVPTGDPGLGWAALVKGDGTKISQSTNSAKMWELNTMQPVPTYFDVNETVRGSLVYSNAITINSFLYVSKAWYPAWQ